jgi:hypothetical protein
MELAPSFLNLRVKNESIFEKIQRRGETFPTPQQIMYL